MFARTVVGLQWIATIGAADFGSLLLVNHPIFGYRYLFLTQISLRIGLCQLPKDSAPLICGLQGRWFLKDGTAVADILDSVVLWDGGGATLLQQTGPNTICIQAVYPVLTWNGNDVWISITMF